LEECFVVQSLLGLFFIFANRNCFKKNIMKKLFLIMLVLVAFAASAQNMTDISLQWKGSTVQERDISSETGDLYQKLNHHGPAVENEWIALRLYFDHKVSVDVYNKTKAHMELAAAGWYPTPEQQKEGWGADQYKVGSTVGLGGVRLWDGKRNNFLHPLPNAQPALKRRQTILTWKCFRKEFLTRAIRLMFWYVLPFFRACAKPKLKLLPFRKNLFSL
jgi:hypothetical protein